MIRLADIAACRACLWAAFLSVALCQEAYPQRLFPELTVRYPVGDPNAENPLRPTEGPKSLATGDLDGDGIADVIAANLDGSVAVLLGTRDGGLRPQLLTPARGLLAGAALRGAATADFDRDGRLDVAVADVTRGVVILEGQGDGTLTPTARLPVPFARALEPGDFNQDGWPDLVVVSSPTECECYSVDDPGLGERALRVLLNQGDGSLGAAVTLEESFAGCPHDVEVFDMNSDGHLDVLALEFLPCGPPFESLEYRGRVRIFPGHGDGTFDSSTDLIAMGHGSRSFTVGYVDEVLADGRPADGAIPDLIVASRDSGILDVFIGLGDLKFQFPLVVPAGDNPRSVAAGDLDQDGLVDLVVTNRNADSISILRGLGDARFDAPVEMAVGRSPRNVTLADMTGDGLLDAAVSNRISGDVSLLEGAPGVAAFVVSEDYYPAGISPVDVVAEDFDGDGLPDVATVSVRSHDVRVRLNTGNGELGPEVVYPVNYRPTSVAADDLNGDGQLDLVVACSGAAAPSSGISSSVDESGCLVALLGRPDGSFSGAIPTFPADRALRPFWLRLGDLSGDDVVDAAVGGTDGSILLFQGRGNGEFSQPVTVPLQLEGRPITITLGDFDNDGLLDLATARGQLVLNDGELFSGRKPSQVLRFGVEEPGVTVKSWVIESADLDRDGNLDLLLTVTFIRPDPIAVFFGRGDGTFLTPTIYEGPDQGVVDLAAADVDSDGLLDIIVGNRCGANVIILRGVGERQFEPLETAQSFRVEGIAISDLNQDTKPDIVGAGIGLWVMINGASRHIGSPRDGDPAGVRPAPGVYINEIMALNREFYRDPAGRTPDWVELYNHGEAPVSLSGWKLRQYNRAGRRKDWEFPPNAEMAGGGHLVVLFSNGGGEDRVDAHGVHFVYNTEFELSRDGETLALVEPTGQERGWVSYPGMPEDVSYARPTDGARFLGYQPVPTPGGTNLRPGNLDPTVDPDNPVILRGGPHLALTARAFDDIGVAYAELRYRLDGLAEFTEVPLRDDGGSGDGVAGDGRYGAIVDVPPDTIVSYSLRIVDYEGEIAEDPDDPSQEADLLAVKSPPQDRPLRITEILADNETGIVDERGQYEDWLEITNCGTQPASLAGLMLTKEYFDLDDAFVFAADEPPLGPGQSVVVFCDDDRKQGPYHTRFRLSRAGDSVLLIAPGEPPQLLDAIYFGPQPADRSYGTPECGAESVPLAWPTPGRSNSPRAVQFVRSDANSDGVTNITDALLILAYLFSEGPPPTCQDAADVDDDGNLSLTDPVRILLHLFAGGSGPEYPFPTCGIDWTADGVSCDSDRRCR